jgi:cbb3-type cytochrome oxidase cytochrome c subunit
MRRSYDPHYGSREQLRDSAEHGMKVARERDKLKTENAALQDEITELKAIIAYMTQGE